MLLSMNSTIIIRQIASLRKPQMWLQKPIKIMIELLNTKDTRTSIKSLVITLVFQATINVLNM